MWQDARIVGMTAEEAERLVPEQRVFIQRIRRGADVMDANSDDDSIGRHSGGGGPPRCADKL